MLNQSPATEHAKGLRKSVIKQCRSVLLDIAWCYLPNTDCRAFAMECVEALEKLEGQTNA
jgi:hypothetical protein